MARFLTTSSCDHPWRNAAIASQPARILRSILHLYEDYGPDCLRHLNGQFALAIWDTRQRSLFLARDRLGIRPLFYTQHQGQLIFGSEIKTLLAYGVPAEIDPLALDQIFTYWSTLSPRSAFKEIYDVPPGSLFIGEGW